MRLLHLSDTHFGTEQAAVLDAVLQLAADLSPTLAVLSGDVTQRARRSEFDAARSFVDRLPVPRCIVMPGNHDIPLFNLALRLGAPYARYRAAFGEALEAEFASDELLLIALNTTRWWRHKNGELSQAQVERVAARLRQARTGFAAASSVARAADAASGPAVAATISATASPTTVAPAGLRPLRVVVTHHPLAVTLPRDRANQLRGHAPALSRWAEAGADLLLGGHIHLPFLLPVAALLPQAPRPAWVLQAGTAVSRRVRPEAPNSVNLIRYEAGPPRRAIVERWDYRAPRFEAVARHELALGD